jgi:hypothetical protein
MMNDDDCGAVGGMLGSGNRSARRRPAPVPLYPPQIPHDRTGVRTRAPRGRKQATNRLSFSTTLIAPSSVLDCSHT